LAFAGRLVLQDVGGFGIEPLSSGVDAFQVASLHRGTGALLQELAEYMLDEGGAGLPGSGDTIDGGQDLAG
jgi:hypothetical protein